MEFKKQFIAALQVSTPLICVRTFDPASAMALMSDALGEAKDNTPLLQWDTVNGLSPLLHKHEASLKAMQAVLKNNSQEITIPSTEMLKKLNTHELEDAIVFMANAHLQWRNDPIVVQSIWNLRDVFKGHGNALIMLTVPGASLPLELANDVLLLDEPLPTIEQLEKVVRNTYSYAKVTNTPDDALVTRATDALIGLPGFAAEQATAMCLEIQTSASAKGKDKETTGKLDVDDLWDRKRQIINQAPGLSIYLGKDSMDDIGGVASAKEFIKAVMEGTNPPKTILFMDEIEKGFAGTGTDMSGTKTELTGSMLSWMQDKGIDGILEIGIPGVSKSALAKAVGGTYGVPVIIFDIAGMQGSLVGESGSNLRSAQATVDAVSGGRVLAIATCNGIDNIPPELRRRFNLATFFFDAPTKEERDIIWGIHRRKYSIAEGEANPPDAGWTGAEIEQCCLKASRLRWSLLKAASYVVPIAVSAKERIERIRSDASGKYLSANKVGIYNANESEEVAGLVPPVGGRRMRDLK